MALARTDSLSFTYPDGDRPALDDVSFAIEPGEVVALLGPSGSGKSTLLRALAGLVPHFHGGRFAGQVEVAGHDTRTTRPSELTGDVAMLFQDPEDQVILRGVANEVAFGLENLATPAAEILPRVHGALGAVGAGDLAQRTTETLSAGELQRVCLASALALEPRLLLLDEPTSQLDPAGAEAILDLAAASGAAVVVSEQRPAVALAQADRVVFVDEGGIALDAPVAAALDWLESFRPEFLPRSPSSPQAEAPNGERMVSVDGASFAYGENRVLDGVSLELARGEVVALTGPNGIGKTTLAKIATGLLTPDEGWVERTGRAAYLTQDPGRFLVCERADDEVALGTGGNRAAAERALDVVGLTHLAARHPLDLSSGERERLALAAVLATEPDVLVLDEPTRGVDPPRKDELAATLRRAAPQRTTLVVTHDLVFAGDVADRIVSLGAREAVLA
jgi:energy-coupling factor transport system ATP-binding protein